ncbi:MULTISPECIES: hypothetical protein [unclassified Pseudodesulfovibrio]|uniref:hypothetical protein n=1 Tax=unclassified Pseudodesulfovibrio TaxID=2661612 RepID=UPI000FEB9430|nr:MULTISPECIES: hypothetical protein [unclassified Pseudodesulfovibrio]MCJ2163699.1 hypothetical protein [Pseudodesulfovibrio sp. S3-i]RWU06046.1 hypothetical protein DWB63_05075 [Pseudodesulfovibrio sp. S3]
MGRITRLPGDGCRYCLNGRCLYEEQLNPGYTQSWRCQVTARWESAYDDFLSRADCFGVEESAVPDIWARQFQRMARDVFHCQRYLYDHGAQAPACLNHLHGVCIVALPKCEGRCRHYLAETDEE